MVSGAGQISSSCGSGGSHGSRGGYGLTYVEARLPVGTIYDVSTWGSGGGSYVANGDNGGRGGGYAHLYVRDTVSITGNGQILASGLNSAVSLTHLHYAPVIVFSQRGSSGVPIGNKKSLEQGFS